MKQLFIIPLCFLTLAACNHKSPTTDDVSPKRSLRLEERRLDGRLHQLLLEQIAYRHPTLTPTSDKGFS